MDLFVNILFVIAIIALYVTIPVVKYNHQIYLELDRSTIVFVINGVTEYYAKTKINRIIMILTLAGVKINNNNLKTIFRFDTEITFVKIS